MTALAKWIYYKWLGWTLTGSMPDIDKCVVIVLPHTSWHDFYIGLLVRRIVKKEIHYVGKKELFRPPFGWYFRWMGGTPIDRSSSQGYVDSIISLFKEKEIFRLAIAPEGTRKKVQTWKTGFYYIAKGAGVPIIKVAFDYGKKNVKIAAPFYPTNNKEADFKEMKAFYQGVVGKVPEYT